MKNEKMISNKLSKKDLLNKSNVKEHLKKVQEYYRKNSTENPQTLGVVKNNPDMMFRWTIVNHKEDKHRFEKRAELGWVNAQDVDLEIDQRSQDASLDGGSVYVKDMGQGSKAILQCIPKELWELNQRAKAKLATTQALVDEDGNILDNSVVSNTKEKVSRHNGGVLIQRNVSSPDIKL